MSCPSWRELLAQRESSLAERAGMPAMPAMTGLAETGEPAGWPEARAHLASCPSCRREALALDPALLFLNLPEIEVGADEVRAMREAVGVLRRTGRLAPERSTRHPWKRIAAAAALLAAGLLLAPKSQHPALSSATPEGELLAQLRQMPLVDELGRPGARVYELGSEELSVVLIVDETFEP